MLIEKVKGELKKEELTIDQLSERLGEKEEKIIESIQILQDKGLIQKKRATQKNQEIYRFKEGFNWAKIVFPSLILLYAILTISMMLMILNRGGSFRYYIPFTTF